MHMGINGLVNFGTIREKMNCGVCPMEKAVNGYGVNCITLSLGSESWVTIIVYFSSICSWSISLSRSTFNSHGGSGIMFEVQMINWMMQ